MIRMRIASVVTGLVIQLVASSDLKAYTGGPKLLDVLGWDAGAHRVYFHTIPADESYEFGAVYYFDLEGVQNARRVRLAWSAGEAEIKDPVRNRRLHALRRRLTVLVPQPAAALGWGTTILKADSATTAMGVVARYRVELSHDVGVRFAFTGYEHPDACVKDIYEIPGRAERLYVLAFRGNPLDVAETQVAVLVSKPSDRPIPVEWERDK